MVKTKSNNKNSQAKITANRKFTEKTYDRFTIYVGKGGRAALTEYVKNNNETLNAYIRKAIVNQLINDNADDELLSLVRFKND